MREGRREIPPKESVFLYKLCGFVFRLCGSLRLNLGELKNTKPPPAPGRGLAFEVGLREDFADPAPRVGVPRAAPAKSNPPSHQREIGRSLFHKLPSFDRSEDVSSSMFDYDPIAKNDVPRTGFPFAADR
jgi:hypothetical protein